jgi:hypothetical protein
MTAIVAASRRGLALGKWVQNFGGAMLIFTVAILICCLSSRLVEDARKLSSVFAQPAEINTSQP